MNIQISLGKIDISTTPSPPTHEHRHLPHSLYGLFLAVTTCQFPVVAVTNYHKLSDLKQQWFIFLKSWRPEVLSESRSVKWGCQQGLAPFRGRGTTVPASEGPQHHSPPWLRAPPVQLQQPAAQVSSVWVTSPLTLTRTLYVWQGSLEVLHHIRKGSFSI